MHLSTVPASEAKLSKNTHLKQEKVQSFLFPKIISLPPPRPPLFPTNGIAVFRFQIKDKSL